MVMNSLQLYQNKRLRIFPKPQRPGDSKADTLETEDSVGICMERKDMAGARFILAHGSRPSLLHKVFPALTLPEWLVKVIQHFISSFGRVISDQRRKGILTG
jgi:hypothetical protein